MNDSVTDTERPLKVCHISLTLSTGGLERLLADFARLADPQRHALSFLAMNERGRFADEIESAGRPVTLLEPGSLVSKVRQMRRFLKQGRFDVVHTHNTYPHIYGTLAARLAGVPVVVNTRHGQRFGMGWRSRLKYRLASRFADRIIAVSDDAAQLCVEADGVAADKVVRIWNGIDTTAFEYAGPAPVPHAVSVARLSPEKNFPMLLRAWAKAVDMRPDLRLTLIGDGSERTNLERLASGLGLGESVTFAGLRTDVPQQLPQFGFFVCPSLSEGISLTLLEAMSVGLPVVATDVGGNPEIVEHDRTGLIVRSDDADAFANAVVALRDRMPEWDAFGRAGRQRVETHFSIGRMIDDCHTLYADLLDARKPRPAAQPVATPARSS